MFFPEGQIRVFLPSVGTRCRTGPDVTLAQGVPMEERGTAGLTPGNDA